MAHFMLPVLALVTLALVSCGGGKKDAEEEQPQGPQTGPGMILDAAKKARDTANDQTRRLEDSARE